MADQLYLSYWLHGFTPLSMLRYYERFLRAFPYSRLARSPSIFRILAVDYSQPPIFEKAYVAGLDPDDVLEAAKDFQNDDCAYRLETWWDLWQYEAEWAVAPSKVTLCCFAPGFEKDLGDDLRIEFGLESHFLPQPDLPEGLLMTESNVKSLLKLVHDLDDALNADRRQLWSESGENFAERLEQALSG
jgi:hypothetical protein